MINIDSLVKDLTEFIDKHLRGELAGFFTPEQLITMKEETMWPVYRDGAITALTERLGPVPSEIPAALSTIKDEFRLRALVRLAATCPDVETFATALNAGTTPA